MKGILAISVIVSILVLGTLGLSQDSFAACRVCGDFNNDGFDDLAIGVPNEDLSGSDEGGVSVIYGSASGLHASLGHADQFWHQDSKGIADTAENGDGFGSALTIGDFNGDTFDDLVVGVPGENISVNQQGAVNVIYGSASGLHRSLGHADQFWHQDSTGIADTGELSDRFGDVLTTGDFNNDGFDDLAVGVFSENFAGSNEGLVHVIYGSASGLHRNLARGDQLWTQDSPGIADTVESGERFGWSLAAGDFNNDGFDDLAIGVDENINTPGEGAVNVIYGSASGLHKNAGRADQFWHQDSTGIADMAENGNQFARDTSLMVGDFNGDTFDDLVIGVFNEDLTGAFTLDGAVNVIYGSASGLHRNAGNPDQFWHQDSKGIADTAESGDQFGRTLTVGDFNNDGNDDLAIGVVSEDLSGNGEGAVNVIYGSASGLHRSLTRGDQFWTQDSKGIADTSETFDNFGVLTSGDFNNDGFDDLAIGVPNEDLNTGNEGAVNVIYGSASGLHRSLGHIDQFWTQNSPGISNTVEDLDCFGVALPGSHFFCSD